MDDTDDYEDEDLWKYYFSDEEGEIDGDYEYYNEDDEDYTREFPGLPLD